MGNRVPSECARPVAGHAQLPALHGYQRSWYQDRGTVTAQVVAPKAASSKGVWVNEDLRMPCTILGSKVNHPVRIARA